MRVLTRNVLVGMVIAAGATVSMPSAYASATAETRTTLTVTSHDSPPPAGEAVYLRAAVKPVSGGAAATGTVTFLDGGQVLGTAPLAADPGKTPVAHISHVFSAGDHSLSARYQGDTSHASSQSLPTPLHVGKAASRIVLSEVMAVKPAGTWNVVAAVKPAKAGLGIVASGTVTFTVDSFAPQTFALNDKGRAHLNLPLSRGGHSVRVSYSGDNDLQPSTATDTFTVA